jgi:hypothetical protein
LRGTATGEALQAIPDLDLERREPIDYTKFSREELEVIEEGRGWARMAAARAAERMGVNNARVEITPRE